MQSLITVKTDGFRDYVILPDGTERNLGTVSVLKLVVELAASPAMARKTLDIFLKKQEAVFKGDLERLYELVAPKRSRWAFDKTLFPRGIEVNSPRDPNAMKTTFAGLLTGIENHLTQMERLASAGDKSSLAREARTLRALVAQLQEGEQESEEKEEEQTQEQSKTAHETLENHANITKHILDRVASTNNRIDALVAEGKRFNASRAKHDLLQVSTRLASLLNDMDLAHPGVRDDLVKLARRADELYSLFI